MADKIVRPDSDDCSVPDVVDEMRYFLDKGILVEKMHAIGMGLRIPYAERDSIRKRHTTSQITASEACEAILQAWAADKGDKATLGVLVAVLEKENCTNVADALRAKFYQTGAISSGGGRGPVDHPQENGGLEKYIEENLPQLLKCTLLSATVYTILISKGVIGSEDKAELESIPNQQTRVMKFYEIIKTRSDYYDTLIYAMAETKQSGVVNILQGFNNK